MSAQATRKHLNYLESVAIVLTLGGGVWLPAARAATILDPQNPTVGFSNEGNEFWTPGAVLTLTDASCCRIHGASEPPRSQGSVGS